MTAKCAWHGKKQGNVQTRAVSTDARATKDPARGFLNQLLLSPVYSIQRQIDGRWQSTTTWN